MNVSGSAGLEREDLPVKLKDAGGVGKRLTPAVLKTVRPERVSWVRIPPPPPASLRFSPIIPEKFLEFERAEKCPECLIDSASSDGRRNTGAQFTRWRFESQCLSGS